MNKINIIGTVLPSIDDQNPENNSDYWAILHLKSYEQTFEKYDSILRYQINLNIQIDRFVDNIGSDNLHNSDKENQLTNIKDDIEKFNKMILYFQKSLKSVIDTSVVELKGDCPIESQLSYKIKLKSYLHLSK